MITDCRRIIENNNHNYNWFGIIWKMSTIFFKEQENENFKKKNTLGQIPTYVSSNGTIL